MTLQIFLGTRLINLTTCHFPLNLLNVGNCAVGTKNKFEIGHGVTCEVRDFRSARQGWQAAAESSPAVKDIQDGAQGATAPITRIRISHPLFSIGQPPEIVENTADDPPSGLKICRRYLSSTCSQRVCSGVLPLPPVALLMLGLNVTVVDRRRSVSWPQYAKKMRAITQWVYIFALL